MWNRNCYRYSDLDFEANLKDGHGIDWPIRYSDLAPWYDYVEEFIGLSGENCGLEHLPDQLLMKPYEMNCFEKHIRNKIEENYTDRKYIQARAALLTQPYKGRGACQSRNLCRRGCPYGAYFSSNASTLPAAQKTGNLTIRAHSLVEKILYDEKLNKAIGVRVIDTQTNEKIDFFADFIAVNASTINSTAILLNSTSENFPNGLGNSSGVLGHYLTDHHDGVGAWGMWNASPETHAIGQKPNQMYIPRFRNIGKNNTSYLRGFAYECFTWQRGWNKGLYNQGIGADFKNTLSQPGPWETFFVAICEALPDFNNKMYLHSTKKDKYGLPQIVLEVKYGENDKEMRKDAASSAEEILKKVGLEVTAAFNGEPIAGKTIHESGTAPMGNDSTQSVLNKWNQLHDCKNVIVTDGACLPSSPCQNPSLTYMALTARAVDHLIKETKKSHPLYLDNEWPEMK